MELNNDFLSQKNHSHVESPPIQSSIKSIEVKLVKPNVQKPLSKEDIEKLNQEKRERVIKIAGIKKTSDYSEYKALNINQIRSLDATNYWRVMNGDSFINVPINDNHFWHYFDERCFGLAELHQERTKDFKEQKRQREELELLQKLEAEKLTKKPVKENKVSEWLNKDLKATQEPSKKITVESKQVKKTTENNPKTQQNLF
jgi:hypothetical protein